MDTIKRFIAIDKRTSKLYHIYDIDFDHRMINTRSARIPFRDIEIYACYDRSRDAIRVKIN